MLGLFAVDIFEQREAAEPIDQREQAPRARPAQDGVSLEVAAARTQLDDLGPILDPGRLAIRRRFAAIRAFAATAQMRLQVLPVRSRFDPGADRLRRHLATRIVGMLLAEAAGDLLGRPIQRQAVIDRVLDARLVELLDQGTLAAARCR